MAGGSGVRLPGGGSMDYYLFTASGGAWLQPGLELSAPLSQPPHDHVLTSTLLNPPGRSMVAAINNDGRDSMA